MAERWNDDYDLAPKERVLHTRVPVLLEEELKRLAESFRVPISNLVRTILQDAVAAAGAMGRVAEGELRGAAQRVARERTRIEEIFGGGSPEAQGAAGPPLAGVIGFQPLILAKRTLCAVCGRDLVPGEQAMRGVRADGSGAIVGAECVPRNDRAPERARTGEEKDDDRSKP
jgi:hypothetical protein